MENEKNKRAGSVKNRVGGRKNAGLRHLSSEKPVASNEGQEEAVKTLFRNCGSGPGAGRSARRKSPISDSETPPHRCILDESFLDCSDQSK